MIAGSSHHQEFLPDDGWIQPTSLIFQPNNFLRLDPAIIMCGFFTHMWLHPAICCWFSSTYGSIQPYFAFWPHMAGSSHMWPRFGHIWLDPAIIWQSAKNRQAMADPATIWTTIAVIKKK
jgi:hypothetical protein